MATTLDLPQPGTIYPDTIDEHNFNFLKKNISTIEAENDSAVQERIKCGAVKKFFTDSGLYTEGVFPEYASIISESIEQLALDDCQLNCMLWLLQKSAARVYLQPRHRISSGDKHIGNIWIFKNDGFRDLFMVKTK